MTVTLTELKQNLDKLLAGVVETGEPLEIECDGHRLKIVMDERPGNLAYLRPHRSIVGDPDELVDLKVWEWREDENL